MRDRAVSNTLGFIVIFSLVLFSLALVSTAGLSGLQDTRDATMSLNAEQSMQSLGNAMEDVYRDNESRRTASMRLGRGTLEPGSSTTITVENRTGGSWETIYDVTFDPIVYHLDDTKIAYEGSAIIREQEGGVRVVRSPSFLLTDDDAIIVPVVNTTAASEGSVGGTTAQVRLRRTGQTTHREVLGGGEDLRVTIQSTPLRTVGWERAFDSITETCSAPSSGEVVCSVSTGDSVQVVVRDVQVEYTLEG